MNIENHPCFNPKACAGHGRIHLPVAPRCNIQCNFCNRKFDCVNETRPGVSSTLLAPHQAMAFLDSAMAAKPNISVVGIAGPGDPLANPEQTIETLDRVRTAYPHMLLCLATNGLCLPDYLDEVKRLNVTHVSLTVNAVDPEIGSKIYAWVRYGKRVLGPEKGARVLLERQMESIKGLRERGVMVKVNTIVLPGINDHHVGDIAKAMADRGVDLLNCMPYYPNPGANFSHMPEPPKETMTKLQAEAEKYLPQMRHCKRCRADAVGLLNDPTDLTLMSRLKDCAELEEPAEAGAAPQPPDRTCIAVATREGVLVNQHLGEADCLSVYDISGDEPRLRESRPMPRPGDGDARWHAMADKLPDSRLILVSGVGDTPKNILKERGIEILMVNGLIHEVLLGIKENRDISYLMKKEPFRCDAQCTGAGMGCM